MEHGERRVEQRVGGRLGPGKFPLAGLAEDAAFLRLLCDGDVQTIHTAEASLDDVFIVVTGRSL